MMEIVLNIDYGHCGLHSCIQLSKFIALSSSLAFFEFSRRLSFARLFLTRAVSDTKFKDLKSCLTMQNQGSHCVSPSPNHRKFHKRWSACLSSLVCLVLRHKPCGLACPAPPPQHSPSCQTQAGSLQIPGRWSLTSLAYVSAPCPSSAQLNFSSHLRVFDSAIK